MWKAHHSVRAAVSEMRRAWDVDSTRESPMGWDSPCAVTLGSLGDSVSEKSKFAIPGNYEYICQSRGK